MLIINGIRKFGPNFVKILTKSRCNWKTFFGGLFLMQGHFNLRDGRAMGSGSEIAYGMINLEEPFSFGHVRCRFQRDFFSARH